MKKQIIAMSVCLALTASSAFATCPLNAKKETKKPVSIEKLGKRPHLSREEAKKHFEAKRTEERECLFKQLGLSSAQKAKIEALDAKAKTSREALMKKFKDDNMALMENYKKDFDAVLTPAQKTKFEKIKTEKKAEMEKFRKEHGPKDFKDHKGPMGPEGPKDCPPPPPEAK